MKKANSAGSGGPVKSQINREPKNEADVIRDALSILRERLPTTWQLAPIEPASRDSGVDFKLRLQAPHGEQVTLLLQAKRLLNTRDVPIALEQLLKTASTLDQQVVVPMLVSRYLAPVTRERIAGTGAGYADVTGNVYISSNRPAIFVRLSGADSDPWRGPGRPRGTLKGPPAARVVRALIDFAPPYSVPELAERAGASIGATYRVVKFVEGLGFADRERRGPITDVRWRPLLERWSLDYGFARSNTVGTFLEPRGLSALTTRLATSSELDYVLTGSLAAERFASYAPPRLAMLYVRDIDAKAAAAMLELRPATTGGNVAIAHGDYDVAFERMVTVDDLRFASVSQTAVDLLSGPGRNPSEALALLSWMEGNEPTWRR